MIGSWEGEGLLEEALKGFYFETDQEELLREPLDMKSRMELHTGAKLRQWEEMLQLIARQPLDNRPAAMLFHQTLRNALFEANKNDAAMQQRMETVGAEGMQSFLCKYTDGNDAVVDDLGKRFQKLQEQLQEQRKREEKSATKMNPTIHVTGGLAAVANDFMPASKALNVPALKKSKRDAQQQREEEVVEGSNDVSQNVSGCRDSSIQSSLGHYFQPNQQAARKPRAFQPPQAPAKPTPASVSKEEEMGDERLAGIDPKLVDIITSEVQRVT